MEHRSGSIGAPFNAGLDCMGYPQRFFDPGYVWHLTARCHNRDFLLNQALYRKLLTDTLFENQARYRVPVLNFTVTSNHVHLLVVSPSDKNAIPEMMRDLGSKVAAAYNKKSDRKGSFWERRYHATAVESGEHLVRCSLYIDTNMVRAKVVRHPSEWKHGGYHEIVKPKQRYKTVNLSELSRLAGMPDDPIFPEHYAGWVENVVRRGHLCRDDVWTAELAVGSEKFVDHVRRQSGYAPILKDESNMLGEQPAPYGPQIDCGNMVEWRF
ncbi:putative transposase [Desulfomicrobium macestii]|uniref:Transposase n=1 Tax=Desulfomicrobium macestii TaxID=90731 RepID=A0ABR9H9F2_9BACT|nr:transposase [Desulfomicrobium macestii]MBE1427330.1 putative transposase [Desulfomicrobium macestii]